jgi:hypothetical protein
MRLFKREQRVSASGNGCFAARPSINGQHLIFFTFRVIVVRDAPECQLWKKMCQRLDQHGYLLNARSLLCGPGASAA